MKAPAGPKGGSHELQEGLTHTSTAPAAAGAAAARVYRPHPKGFTTEGTTAGSDRESFAVQVKNGARRFGSSVSQSSTNIVHNVGHATGLRHRALSKHHGSPVPASPRTAKRAARVSERYGMAGFKASMTSYKTAKFHVVEDPVLATVFRGMQFMCVVYAAFKMIYQHGYLKVSTPTGNANVYAEMKTEAHVDVGSRGFTTALPLQGYCCKDYQCKDPNPGKGYNCFTGHSMEFNGCRNYKFGEVIRKKKNGIFVVTYVTNTITQSKNASAAFASKNAPEKGGGPHSDSKNKTNPNLNYTRNFYVPDVEEVKIAALTSFDVLGRKPPLLNQKENGNAKQFSPVEVWSGTGPNDPAKKHIETLPPKTNGKISFPLRKWLRLCGVTLDDKNVVGAGACDNERKDSPLYRMTGYYINVNLYVSNFKKSPATTFTSTIPTVSHIYVSQGSNKGWMSYVPGVSYTRGWPLPLPLGHQRDTPEMSNNAIADAYTYGVYLNFEFSGEYGQFDFATMLGQFVQYVVIMSIAPLITDTVMLYLMGDKSQIYKDSKNVLLDGDAVNIEKEERKEEERAAIQAIFTGLDENESGVLEHNEVQALLVKMGYKSENVDEMEQVISQIDVDDDGAIDLEEFTTWWMNMMDCEPKKFKKLSHHRRQVGKEMDAMQGDSVGHPQAELAGREGVHSTLRLDTDSAEEHWLA